MQELIITNQALIRACLNELLTDGLSHEEATIYIPHMLDLIEMDRTGVHPYTADGPGFNHPKTGRFMQGVVKALNDHLVHPFFNSRADVDYAEVHLKSFNAGTVEFAICHLE